MCNVFMSFVLLTARVMLPYMLKSPICQQRDVSDEIKTG